MRRIALVLVFLPSMAAWPGQEAGNDTRLNGHVFTLPAGFEIELVAGPPLVDRPIAIDFDDAGRLLVTESSGSSEAIEVQAKKKPHRILQLQSSRGDGKFDKRTVFADGFVFPEGVMCFKGSVFVTDVPSIWKLTDSKGTGVADQRVEWFNGKTVTRCANDLHGPYRGPDGWIYWCKGAFAKQTYELPSAAIFETRAAHIFRARPDGSGVEPVMTGGMDNPVDLVFTPGGERIFDTTFLQYPAGGKRDGLIHAVYGGLYGKDYRDVLDGHVWTGPSLMPVLAHLGAAAPAGLHCYESEAFGEEYKDNIFTCCFNMQKVTRHVLVQSGSTFQTTDSDFLVSDNKDFHPTDVIEDADGSLLVVDTGGWYKLCCPTSQLVRPEVLGGIYRIRKKNMPALDDSRGLKIDWKRLSAVEMAGLLGDARPYVRRRAIEALGDGGENAAEALAKVLAPGSAPLARLNAVWAAARNGDEKARAVVRQGLGDADETVRQAAIHCASVLRDREAEQPLMALLQSKSLHNRRAAAEALGRCGGADAFSELLAGLDAKVDHCLEHSLLYAMIEIANDPLRFPRAEVRLLEEAEKTGSANERRAALVVGESFYGVRQYWTWVLRGLEARDARVRETAWWIAGRHPGWGEMLETPLKKRLAAATASQKGEGESKDRVALVELLARFARTAAVQKLLARQLDDDAAKPGSRKVVLEAMGRSGQRQPPADWAAAVAKILTGGDGELVQAAALAAMAWRDAKESSAILTAALLEAGSRNELPDAVRLSAWSALPGGMKKVNGPQLAFLLAAVGPERPFAERSSAASILGRAKLELEQLREVAGKIPGLGPLEIDRVLDAFAGATDEALGLKLFAALHGAAAKNSLRPEMLKPRLAKFGPVVQEKAAVFYASLHEGAGKQQARLNELMAGMKVGDVARGRQVFNSQKAACFSCHAIGYRGGDIGPDLTRIARTRTERDLLEAVVFPSASFVRGYEPMLVTTKDGRVMSGLLKREAADEIVLQVSADQSVRIGREQIDEMRPSQVSLMPAGFDGLLTSAELADLVAFLKACK
jgi:putative membrane-bound dehydrogenase-like protein